MFSNLTNFGYKRSFLQALGFYIAYFVLAVLLGGLLGGISGLFFGASSYELGVRMGTISSVILSLVLGILIASSKGILSSFTTIVLIILAGIIAMFIGALGGLIPIAFLTTREDSNSKQLHYPTEIDES